MTTTEIIDQLAALGVDRTTAEQACRDAVFRAAVAHTIQTTNSRNAILALPGLSSRGVTLAHRWFDQGDRFREAVDDALSYRANVDDAIGVAQGVVLESLALCTCDDTPPPPPPPPPPGDIAADRAAIIAAAGPTGTLTKVGSITTTSNGQVIENVECGNIVVKHADVTIRNIRQHVTARYGIDASLPEAKDLTVENVELYATTAKDQGGPSTLIYARGGLTLRRAKLTTAGNDCLKVNDSYLDAEGVVALASKPPGSANHSDGIQVRKATRVHVLRSVIDAPHTEGGNAALIIQAAEGPIDDVLIEANHLGGGNNTVYTTSKGYPITNVRILGNVFSRVFRYGIHYGRFDEWTVNIWTDGTEATP